VLAGGLYERTSGAAGQPLGNYQRRAPERTVLHELVATITPSQTATDTPSPQIQMCPRGSATSNAA
jgi:hypothetical protein